MKTLHTALLASSFMIATYIAVPANGNGLFTIEQVEDVSKEEKETNFKTDVAIEVARQGFPIQQEVDDLKRAVNDENASFPFPGVCVIDELLQKEINDLHARALAFVAHEMEVRQAQFQVVLARFERAVLKIEQAWQNGEITEEIAFKTIATMRADAFDYLQSLGLTNIRPLLEAAIAELVARGHDAMDRAAAQHDAYVTLYRLRLEAALAVLQTRIQDGTVTKQDFDRIQAIVAGLEALRTNNKPYVCDS